MSSNNENNKKIDGKLIFVDGHELSIAYSATEITKDLYTGTQDIKEVILPPNAVKIGARAFSWYKNMKSITIPEGLTHIGEGAFNRCAALQKKYLVIIRNAHELSKE